MLLTVGIIGSGNNGAVKLFDNMTIFEIDKYLPGDKIAYTWHNRILANKLKKKTEDKVLD